MQIDEFISHLDNVKACGNGQYIACCPAHEDKKQSLSIGAKDGKILLNCFAGCEARDIVAAVGLQMSDLFSDSKPTAVYTRTPKAAPSRPVPKRRVTKPCFTHTKEYIYTDEDGAFVARKIKRYNSGGDKSFLWKHLNADGKEVNGNGMSGSPMYLYNIAELCHNRDALAADDTPVYIVEGEKDADTLKEMGLVAVSMPNGAGSKWDSGAYNRYFSGLCVVILADNDSTGKKSGNQIAAALTGTARRVKLIYSEAIHEGLKEKGDISDIAAEIGIDKAKEKLLAAESITPEYEPQSESERTGGKLPMFIIEKESRNGDIHFSVSAPQLAEYIRKNEHYFFLDTGGEKPLLFIYSGGCYKHRSDNDFKSMIKKPIEDFDKNLVRSRDLDEVFKLLSTDQKTVKASELDADEELINFQNGLLNIRTLELFPHSPEILSTVQRPCNWNPKATSCPTFEKYIDTLTADEDEQNAFESKMLLLQFLGLIISNVRGYRTKKALFLVGAGNSGKSQFLELAARLVGDENFASIDLQSLEERFGTAAIWRKRLVGAPDMSYQRVSEMKLFKKITGGDRIDFEFKGRDRFTDVFRGVLVFCCNALPKFGGDKGRHVYERMLVLPCDNVIPAEQRDPNIIEKLFDEREGIVYNAVLCLKQLVEENFRFTIPKKSVDVIESHAVENDSVLRFLQECTEPRDKIADSEPTKGRIYQTFKNWATDAREYIPTKADFNQSIAQKYGVPDVKSITAKVHGNEFYRPFRLTKQALEDYGY